MGLFSKTTRGKDFDVEANAPSEPPLVVATPIDNNNYASSLLPTPAEAINTNKINISTLPPFKRQPTNIPTCPNCGKVDIMTRTSTFATLQTWLLALGLLVLFWPICWLPLVVDSAKKTEHICTYCHTVVGTVQPMSDCCVKEQYWEREQTHDEMEEAICNTIWDIRREGRNVCAKEKYIVCFRSEGAIKTQTCWYFYGCRVSYFWSGNRWCFAMSEWLVLCRIHRKGSTMLLLCRKIALMLRWHQCLSEVKLWCANGKVFLMIQLRDR